jgi:hypothetical protein
MGRHQAGGQLPEATPPVKGDQMGQRKTFMDRLIERKGLDGAAKILSDANKEVEIMLGNKPKPSKTTEKDEPESCTN